MIRNLLIVSWRNFRKHTGHSLLNLAGLIMGLTCCFFIAIYINDENSYDRWVPEHERVFRISASIKTQDNDRINFALTPGTLFQAFKAFPEVASCVRIFDYGSSAVISTGDQKKIAEKAVYYTDSTLLTVLSYPLAAGDPHTAMNSADGIMLTEEKAQKYFGKQSNSADYLNRLLDINGTKYRVTGVLKNIPFNTYFRPDFVVSTVGILNKDWFKDIAGNWHGTAVHTFVKLGSGVSGETFGSKIRFLAYQYVGDEIKANGQEYTYVTQPLADIHLHSNFRYELSKNTDIMYVRTLSFIAIFILIIAGINFVNLTTAKAAGRAKEVSVRKVIGARRGQLMLQFLTEALIMSGLAFLGTVVLIAAFLPLFNNLADKHFAVAQLLAPRTVMSGIGISLAIGLLSGIYPAVVLSDFHVSRIVQRHHLRKQGTSLRNVLVVTQFSISILLIIATIVVYNQLRFMQQHDLGFDQSQVLVLPVNGKDAAGSVPALLERFKTTAGVMSVTASSSVPGGEFGNNLIPLKGDHSKQTDTRLLSADDQFLRTYNIQLLAGRQYSMKLDTGRWISDVMINEAALPFFGWKTPEEAIGKEFDWGWGRVCGVYRNFNFTSLQRGVTPLAIFYKPGWINYISVKMNTRNASGILTQLEKTWQQTVPSMSFNYFFLDDEFNQQYRAEQRLGKLFILFSIFAIAIACLGLFGLASFTTEQRTKEIGIRKVLGASVTGITWLLSGDFLKLVLWSFAIAFPVSWWAMSRWLQDFAYRVSLSAWIFIVAGAGAIVIALLTVSVQAIKAALANPVNSLRSE
ncbi:FtsX-like permease family protein [Chitinophaga sp. 212800010-3]|uniref:ABC transporter permease n=1 Tax=unclassified Chitinophaga TaxID=2619133 RepID=UPI002DF15AB7|nr:putative ABC transport system permease protein [Chitinophaga sp. 212800010-3]